MLKIIAATVAALVAVILIIAATRPDSFHVERAIDIKAPPEKLFPFLSSLGANGFGAWSPYEKKDPNMKRSYSGPQTGKGAVYEWQGNSEVGSGRLEIIDASPTKVTMKLDFLQPFEGHNTAEFSLLAAGDLTHVIWSIDGPSSFITKLMEVFFNMDKMIGGDFEIGLSNLKTLAEQ